MLILFIAGHFFGRKFEGTVRVALTEVFNPKVDSLHVHFSFLKHFPHPSLEIHKLRLSDTVDHQPKEILYLENASFQFDIFQFLGGNYAFRKVKLNDGYLLFYTDSIGNNIRPFRYRSPEDMGEPRDLKLNFPKIEAQNIKILADNQFKKAVWSLQIQDGLLNGAFEGDDIQLEGQISTVLDSMIRGENRILGRTPIALSTKFHMNTRQKRSEFTESTVQFANAVFGGGGSIQQDFPNGSILDISLNGEGKFDAILGLLPDEFQGTFKQTNPTASAVSSIKFDGLAGPKHSARMDLGLLIQDAVLEMKDAPLVLDSLEVEATYTTGDDLSRKDNHLIVKNLSTYLNQKPIRLKFELLNLDAPQIDLDFDVELDLADLTHISPIEGITQLGGLLDVSGNYNSGLETPTSGLNGGIIFEEDVVQFKNGVFPLTQLNGQVDLKGNQATINALTGKLSDIPFTIKGNCDNIVRLVFDNKRDLNVSLNIDFEEIYANIFFNTLSKRGKRKRTSNESHPLDLPSYIRGKVNVRTPKFYYKNETARNVKVQTVLQRNKIRFPLIRMDVLEGSFDLKGELVKNRRNNFMLYSHIDINNINTRRMLAMFNNFSQNVITDKHIKGYLGANLQLSGELDNNLDFLEDDFSYNANFTLNKGELIDFEPLTKGFKFIKKEEAAHVLIEDLKGRAIYHKNQVLMPELTFNSNLSYVTLFGIRQADKFLEWNLELSLGDLLFKSKRKKLDELLGKRKAKRGKMNARVELSGMPYQLGVRPKRREAFLDDQKDITRRFNRKKRSFFRW